MGCGVKHFRFWRLFIPFSELGRWGLLYRMSNKYMEGNGDRSTCVLRYRMLHDIPSKVYFIIYIYIMFLFLSLYMHCVCHVQYGKNVMS